MARLIGGHPHEVVCPREEGRERRAERLPAEHLHPHRGGDHLLLRDVHLDEPLGMGVLEDLGEGRVGDLAVERDDRAVRGAERRERLAVRLAGRDRAADLVRRPRRRPRLERGASFPGSGFATSIIRLRTPPISATASSEIALPCQPFSFSTFEYPLPFTVFATIAVGRPVRRLGLAVGRVDRLDVVAVDLDRMPAERLEPARVRGEVPAVHRLAALAEPVDVDDRGEVVELVEGRVLRRLPHRPLCHLAVAADDPDAEREAVEPLAGDRHPDADRQALAERPGRDVDPGEDGNGMPLEPRAELPVRAELLLGDARRRRGTGRTRAARRGPWRTRAGRSAGRGARRSRTAGAPRAGPPRGPPPTSRTSGGRTRPSRSPEPRRPAAAVPTPARARARP